MPIKNKNRRSIELAGKIDTDFNYNYRNRNVDTRSDTTRKGYNEGKMSSVQSNSYHPFIDIYNAIDYYTNATNPNSLIYNPGLITGEVPTPGFRKDALVEAVKKIGILRATKLLKDSKLLKAAKSIKEAPLIVRNINKGLNKGQKDLLYHLDYGDNIGSFSNKGAYIKNNKLVPGKSKNPDQLDYIWFNEGKPYSTAVKGKSFNRAIIINKNDVPNLIRVRESKVPIGQWTGNSGFVTKAEMVTPSEVPLQNAYIYNRKNIPLIGNFWLRAK